jgi:hypothetical protein
MTEANGHLPYPDGPARNPSAVQRGSVQYLSCEVSLLVLTTKQPTSRKSNADLSFPLRFVLQLIQEVRLYV